MRMIYADKQNIRMRFTGQKKKKKKLIMNLTGHMKPHEFVNGRRKEW